MNAVVKFELHFDKEDLTFRDGEYITGFLELILSEDIKYKSIYFEIKGYSLIRWDGLPPDPIASEPNDSAAAAAADAYKEHCSEKCIMLDKIGNFLDKDPTLQVGEHVFPFEVRVPKEVPSSFEGQYGRVRYEGRGVIERPSSGFKSNKSVLSRHDLVVLSTLDLNMIPEAFFKIEICKYKELGLCCTEGSLTIDWVVERSGFVPTEEVTIMGSVQNDSKHSVLHSGVSLIMVVEYRLKKRRLIDRVRVAHLEKGRIGKDDVAMWNDTMVVPSCPPSSLGRSKLVDISYELEFKVTLEDGHSSCICYTKTIYVGNVMLARRTADPGKTITLGCTPAFVAGDAAFLVPCYAPVQQGVVLTSPPRTNDIPGFHGNYNAGFVDAFARGENDATLEDRPPPYAPGHNLEDANIPSGLVGSRDRPPVGGDPVVVAPVRSCVESHPADFDRTLCIRKEVPPANEETVGGCGVAVERSASDKSTASCDATGGDLPGGDEGGVVPADATPPVEPASSSSTAATGAYRLEKVNLSSKMNNHLLSPPATSNEFNEDATTSVFSSQRPEVRSYAPDSPVQATAPGTDTLLKG